jgi:hypothetical protein
METEIKKHRYYLYSDKTFKEESFTSDEDAITAGKDWAGCIRVIRARDGTEVWVKPSEPVFLKA